MTTAERSATRQIRIGELLVQADIVQEHQLPRALQMAKDRSLKIGQVLIMMRFLSAEDLEPILEIQKLINEGSIEGDEAVQVLKVMRRDGLPLSRALEMVRIEPENKAEKQQVLAQAESELKAMEAQPGLAERDLVPLLFRVGDARVELRELTEAERSYRRGLSIQEHSYGSKHLRVSTCLLKLIDLHMLQQRYTDAEPLCWRLVDIHQNAYGMDHLEVARSLEKLARVLDAQSRFPEAEQFLLSSIRIMEKQLGVENPELKSALRHLSAFWRRKAKKAEHKPIGELLVEAQLVGEDTLASALQESHTKAIPLGQTLLSMQAINPAVLRAGLQAQLLIQDGVVPAAVAVKALQQVGHKGLSLEDALEEIGWSPDPISTRELDSLMSTADELMAAEKALGTNHPGVAVLALKLGEQYTQARKFAYAESAFKRALGILKQCWGQNSVELANCMFSLANLYYIQKRFSEAEPMHWSALEIRKNVLGEDHADVAMSLEHIAALQDAQGNEGQAKGMRQAAALIRSKDSLRRKEIAAFLTASTVFRVVDDRVVSTISATMEDVTCTAGQIVLQDMQEPEALYIVYKGSVELVRDSAVVAYLSVGDCFGDLDYPNTGQHHGAVRIPEEAHLLKLASSSVRELKNKLPALQVELAKVAEQRASETPLSSAQTQGLQGNLAFFDLTTVLQTIVNSRKDGVLRLTNHKKEDVAAIAVRDGSVVYAKYRHLEGPSALYDLLARNDPLDFAFDSQSVVMKADEGLTTRPLTMLIMEAARRADELPALLESVGWPRSVFLRSARVLDCSAFDPEVASVAADIWMLIDEGADNERVADGVYADRYTFLLAMREMLNSGCIRKDMKSTGSFNRLIDLSDLQNP